MTDEGRSLLSSFDFTALRDEPTPARSLWISLLALVVAAGVSLLRPEDPDPYSTGQFAGLVWLLALIPPFMLSYYRGWKGAVVALAIGMVALTGAEVIGRSLLLEGQLAGPIDPLVYGVTTVGLIFVSLGAGITSEALHRAGGDPVGAEARAHRRREIERAIEDGQLVLHYQPIVSFADGGVAGLEALVRWNHPRRGMVAPDQFISFAESTDLIIPLGNWVLEEACSRHGAWRDYIGGGEEFYLSVNLAVRQVRQPGLRSYVRELLREYGLPPEALQLEITESTLLEAGTEIETLKELGVHLAIDDFGKGYSSLSYLSRLEVDGLKIDGSFVSGMDEDRGDHAIVESVIKLAQTLDMTVTAEGIETEQQYEELRRLGCEYGQGYYLSRPFPLERMERPLPLGR